MQVKDKRLMGGGSKAFFSKLSRGLMLPIALLPIAGIFLGVGAGIENIIKQVGDFGDIVDANGQLLPVFVFPYVMKNIGDVIFANLPILFAVGIAIAFTEDAGVAALSAVVGWAVFNMTQNTMIYENTAAGNFNILWYTGVPGSVVGSNIGIRSMQTSVFGGLAVGFIVAGLYNKFHTFQMPKVLGFFSGTRFVPIITFLTMPILGFTFLMTWPAIGIGLERMGAGLANAPAGTDALAFGYIERSLIPFGLHHAFYTPLWTTSVGGNLFEVTGSTGNWTVDGAVLAQGNQKIWFEMISQGINFNDMLSADVETIKGAEGNFHILTVGTETFALTQGVSPGSYMQGKFPFMMFGLPAAGIAMVMAAKKENREVAASIIGAAAATSFLTGITEPIEFTFLFLAPWLFFGFHAVMAASSFWILDLVGTNVGMTFSGGIFDLMIFGLVPDVTGAGVDHWHVYWLGILMMPVYYVVFYYSITKLDIPTPGREGAAMKLTSKADYQASKDKNSKMLSASRVDTLVKNLGGMDNLKSIDACITRLRLTVNDRSLVNDASLTQMGAMGIVGKGQSVQVIFGAEADAFKVALLKLRK